MPIEANRRNHTWYEAYLAAMLQTDLGKLPESVACAHRAIQVRSSELSSVNCRESEELTRATHFLRLLLHCAVDDGGKLSA